ncbi:DUF4349 domain-containing protein [Aquihabitans daechungensis]|uniref:DUF4349 domain-containing protein n=1 Tax=Aquihabitans daechungensis TaxID=1052257 RepID=UPI003BA2A3C4
MARRAVEPKSPVVRRTRMRVHGRWVGGVVGLMLAAGALAACSGTGDEASQTAGDATEVAGGGSAALAAELAKGPAVGAQAEDREVVYTGSLTVRVPNAETAATEAEALAEDVDGYLGKQDSQLEGDRQVDLTLRVPAAAFDEVMAQAAALGKVQARKVDSEDVTDQVVDLKGRLENAQASTERLRTLLGKAENVQNIAALEERLTQREAEIEQISGQLEVIQDDVRFATISITFTEKDEPAVSDDLPGPLQALEAGGVAFVTVVLGLLAALAFALPFLAVGLVGWLGYRRWRRRHPKPDRTASSWPGAASPLPPPPDPEGS